MADRREFVALITPHIGAMKHAAISLVGMDDAEDAAQEAILRAWQTWDTLKDAGATRAWLVRITVNVCLQWRRGWLGKRIARTEPLDDGDGDIYVAPLSIDPGASDHTGAMDIRSALNRLDADQRLIIVLRFYTDLDSTEAGAALGIPAATFRTRLRRALVALRNEMNQGATVGVETGEERDHA